MAPYSTMPLRRAHSVYTEVLLREANNESPQLNEYLRRFPHLAAQLTPLFEVHRALESDQLLSPEDSTQACRSLPRKKSNAPGPGRTFKLATQIFGGSGRGGMGVVYIKPATLAFNRLVALKMILAGSQATTGQLARFRAEAEAVARLQHPNIVQVHEVGEEKGHPYFSMEFVNGGNLGPSAAWHSAAGSMGCRTLFKCWPERCTSPIKRASCTVI